MAAIPAPTNRLTIWHGVSNLAIMSYEGIIYLWHYLLLQQQCHFSLLRCYDSCVTLSPSEYHMWKINTFTFIRTGCPKKMSLCEMVEVRISLNTPSFSIDVMSRIWLTLDPPKAKLGGVLEAKISPPIKCCPILPKNFWSFLGVLLAPWLHQQLCLEPPCPLKLN